MERRVTPEEAVRFRTPLPVREVMQYRSGEAFPVCPRCGVSMEREYQNYCDRCGQRLGWKQFRRAQIVTRF